MASIKDFFAGSSALTMERPTHGTTGQAYSWSCYNDCCYCIPTSTTTWVTEMWGMGGGGASGCCCEWGCRGGGGSNYGSKVINNWSCGSAQTLCYCACSCYCYSPSSDGAPGQFSRITNCTETGLNNSSRSCIGGGTGGCSCCNYGGTPSYMQSINPDSDLTTLINSGGGGTAGSISGFQSTTTNTQGNAQSEFGNPHSGFSGASAVSGSGGGGALDTPFPPGNTNCSSGPITQGSSGNCTIVSRRGACGYSRLNNSCNVSCPRGAGGASYAGAYQNECCFQPGNWAYCGCNGMVPGGGGVTAGVCSGGCCRGSCGAQGVILISYDA